MRSIADLMRNPAVSAVVGAGALTTTVATSAYRGLLQVPIVGPTLQQGISALSERGEIALSQAGVPIRALITSIAVELVDQVLAELDITTLVRDRVDIDAIVAEVDINAIIARLDLVGLADEVIDGVDLPKIIRDSTTSVTAEVMTDVRSQGARADDMVSGIVDRMLGRSDRAER